MRFVAAAVATFAQAHLIEGTCDCSCRGTNYKPDTRNSMLGAANGCAIFEDGKWLGEDLPCCANNRTGSLSWDRFSQCTADAATADAILEYQSCVEKLEQKKTEELDLDKKAGTCIAGAEFLKCMTDKDALLNAACCNHAGCCQALLDQLEEEFELSSLRSDGYRSPCNFETSCGLSGGGIFGIIAGSLIGTAAVAICADECWRAVTRKRRRGVYASAEEG